MDKDSIIRTVKRGDKDVDPGGATAVASVIESDSARGQRRTSASKASKPDTELYQPPLNPTLAPHVMAGLDPAIGYPQQIANDAIPVSNHPMTMTGSSPVMTGLDRCVRYVNSQGGWY